MPGPLSIRIANNIPTPNGNAAVLSISGANGNPNQATWTANDRAYQIMLPADVWAPPSGASLSFTLAQGATSGVYTLQLDAPTGIQTYSIAGPGADPIPKVLIQV
jgi:hypothetical protein